MHKFKENKKVFTTFTSYASLLSFSDMNEKMAIVETLRNTHVGDLNIGTEA